MSEHWKHWEGRSAGEFPLLRYLGGSVWSAVFLTERHEGDSVVGAAIKLVAAASPGSPALSAPGTSAEDNELQLSRWWQAAELSHPYLIRLHEMGRSEVDGVPVLYVVMERAEENLAQVLPERALTPDEARTILEGVLNVLGYLHGKGFVQGNIRPSNIMAIGDQLKLSSEGLRRAGESLAGSESHGVYDPPENARGIIPVAEKTSSAGDVWSLGVTLVEILTGRPPVASTAGGQISAPQTLPQPFLDIATHCLLVSPQSRWTIAQIAERLQGRAPVSAAAAAAATASAGPQASVRGAKSRARRSSGATGLIAGGFALILAAVLGWLSVARRHSEARPAPAAAAIQGAVQPEQSQGATSAQEDATQATAPSAVSVPGPRGVPEASGVPSFAREDHSSKALAPKPASIQSEALPGQRAGAGEKPLGNGLIHGEVAQQVMPDVLQSARDTVRGTLKVSVKVDVDPSGDVENAELASPGSSKYFAGAALKAAQKWKFKPPQVDGRGVLSTWTLEFQFTADGTNVVPTETMP
jgi:eukaryotic-like serine/threonine-protein kinase